MIINSIQIFFGQRKKCNKQRNKEFYHTKIIIRQAIAQSLAINKLKHQFASNDYAKSLANTLNSFRRFTGFPGSYWEKSGKILSKTRTSFAHRKVELAPSLLAPAGQKAPGVASYLSVS